MGEIPVITDWVEQSFLEGTLEVYDTFFTKKIPFYPLDEEATEINSYGETSDKKYKEPVYLTARVKIQPEVGEKAINRDNNVVYIRIPTQNMWDNGLTVEAKDLAEMLKGKFSWNGIDYQPRFVHPLSMINNSFLFHEFVCDEIILDSDYREG